MPAYLKRPLGAALTLLLILTTAVGGAGCSNEAQSKNADEEEETSALPVETALPHIGDIAAFFSGTATLEAEEETQVAAKSGGIVKEIYVEEGDYVQADQALAQLDDERLVLELARAKSTLDKLRRDFERNQELYNQQLVSSETYERAKSDYETQQAAYDLAELSLAQTTVRAPISGTISERLIKMGNMIQTFAPTFRLTDFDPLLAVMHVPERELQKLRVGQPANVVVDALAGASFVGKIKRISPIVDPTTGTFKVTLEIRDRSRQLKPGMFGRIGIVYDTHTETLLIPKEAVSSEDDIASVFVVRDAMAFRQTVETGYEDARHIEILAGLALEQPIIISGQSNLRDSTKVEVVNF